MRLEFFFLVLILLFGSHIGHSQHFFPVKLNKKWGLINTDGKLVQSPIYDAIGEFKHFGYAVMQKNGAVGLLGPDGKESLEAHYDDIKVLSKNLFAVMQDNEWRVINPQGQTVLDKGYARVHILKQDYLIYQVNGKWGLVKANGDILAAPKYDKIETKGDLYFQTKIGNNIGLLALNGKELLACIAAEIRPTEQGLIFYRKSRLWGAIDQEGVTQLAVDYESYRVLDATFYKLFAHNKTYLYSQSCGALLKQTDYSDFYVFSDKYLAAEKNQRLGLVNVCGQQVIPSLYQEIQPYGDSLFRVSFEGSWGVVNRKNSAVIPLAYQYISPMQGPVCVVKQADLFGVINIEGEVVIPPSFQRIELEEGQARAYQMGQDGQEELIIFTFDDDGKLVQNNQFTQHFQIKVGGKDEQFEQLLEQNISNFQLKKFEWFYDPTIDRWGLRSIIDGKIQIEPTFDFIQIEKDLGYTIVGIWKSNDYEFERTSFRYDMIFGLVLNELGILVTEVDFLDIRIDDFQQERPNARVVFSNGRHGLINRLGRIIRKDITYIGQFEDGLARVSFNGKLSGARETDYSLGSLNDYMNSLLSPSYMLDYTQYDQLFQQNAALICQDCEWGYIDTLGQVAVKPSYTFALDIVNQSGLVNCSGKWGMINQLGQELIPCQYDYIEFLENTDNRMVRVYLEQPKYGLIDTLGQLTVSAVYEEIGSFSDGRLAVKRNGMWGFVNRNGQEVIPCRFDEVQNFSEGKAAVSLQKEWGFIDIDGDVVIPFQYKEVGNFKQELAWVKTNEGIGYINEEEEFYIPPSFDKAFDFSRGVARVVVQQQYGLINTAGDFIIKPRYGKIEAFDDQGLAIFKFGRDQARHGLMNLSGQVITQSEFRSINPFREGRALVRTKQGFGFLDTKGRMVIRDKFGKAGEFHEGRAMVQQKNKCGYIDLEGEIIVPCSYSRCQDFSGGRAVVYQGIKNAGIIGINGELIVEPSLDRLLEFQEGRGLMRDDNYRFYYITEQTSLYDGYYDRATAFHHGVAVVQIDGKWGIINQKGIEIIPPKYDRIDSFEDGYAKVKIEGYNGLSNLNGQLIVQPHYEFISYAGEGLFRVEQGDKIGYFDSEGSWVWELNK